MEVKFLCIKKDTLNDLRKRALSSDIEVCAVLLGKVEGDKAIVYEIKYGKNIRESSIEFEIDPSDLYKIIIYGERKGLEVIGLAHSHPAAPKPSKSDLNGMKLWPVPWLIISSIDGAYACFIYEIKRKEIREIKVILT
mgnify:CR=1 FL=1